MNLLAWGSGAWAAGTWAPGAWESAEPPAPVPQPQSGGIGLRRRPLAVRASCDLYALAEVSARAVLILPGRADVLAAGQVLARARLRLQARASLSASPAVLASADQYDIEAAQILLLLADD